VSTSYLAQAGQLGDCPCAPVRRWRWEPIVEDGRIVGMVCPDYLTLREQRRIRAEHARVIRRLKRGLPLS